MGILKGIAITIGGILAIGAAVALMTPKPTPRTLTDAEKKQEAESMQVAAAVKALKAAAKDPTSFKLDQVLAMPDGAGCISYHAKNSFGASVPGQAVVSGGKVVTADRDGGSFTKAHDKHCGGKSGKDITSYTRQFI